MAKFPNYLTFLRFEFCISVIRDCFEIRLPARSPFGEGRDFLFRICFPLSHTEDAAADRHLLNLFGSLVDFK